MGQSSLCCSVTQNPVLRGSGPSYCGIGDGKVVITYGPDRGGVVGIDPAFGCEIVRSRCLALFFVTSLQIVVPLKPGNDYCTGSIYYSGLCRNQGGILVKCLGLFIVIKPLARIILAVSCGATFTHQHFSSYVLDSLPAFLPPSLAPAWPCHQYNTSTSILS